LMTNRDRLEGFLLLEGGTSFVQYRRILLRVR